MCSDAGHGDLTGNDSWELGGLGAKILEAKGLKGPRGNGSTRGRGGSRRSSVISVALLGALAIERTLLGGHVSYASSNSDSHILREGAAP